MFGLLLKTIPIGISELSHKKKHLQYIQKRKNNSSGSCCRSGDFALCSATGHWSDKAPRQRSTDHQAKAEAAKQARPTRPPSRPRRWCCHGSDVLRTRRRNDVMKGRTGDPKDPVDRIRLDLWMPRLYNVVYSLAVQKKKLALHALKLA